MTTALLTGVPAGIPDAEGNVSEGTVNYMVSAQLMMLSQMRKEFSGRNGAGRAAAGAARGKKGQKQEKS